MNTAASSSPWRAWWASLGERGGVARGDIAGGLTAALVLPAIEGSYGLVAFGGLGADLAQTGFLLGAYTAGVATIVTLLAGGRGPMLSGSSAALALLLASLLGWLITDPRFVGADGRPFLPMLLAFSGLGLVLAGLIQVVVARLKLGVLVRYVPYPVHAGYMNGVAVLMIAAVFTHLLGIPSGSELEVLRTRPLALLVALTALWFALRAPKWTQRIPPYLTGLLAAAALHHLLALTPWAGALGPQFEPPNFQWPSLEVLAPVADSFNTSLLTDKIGMLLLFALAVAMMSTLQTALAGSTLDELTHKRRDSERELLAQGVANMAVGAIGALPSAGSTTRGKINIDAGGATAMSRLVFGMALLLALAYGLQFMSLLPMAAIAGVFVAVAFSLVDDWTRRATAVLARQTVKRRVPIALAQNYAVMLLVAGVTIFVSLALAIALGTFVAMVQFIRSNCKRPVRQVAYADRRSSRKVRPVEQTELLRQHGRRIAVVELDGALFFGTAEAADEEIEHLARASEFIIIDFERVGEVDASGARVLLHAADSVARAGKLLLLAGLTAGDARTRIILDMDVHGRLDRAQFFPDTDRALEFAEDRLLDVVAPERGGAGSALSLGATLMGRGLSEQEIALLTPLLTERRFARGEAVFRRGEPGDAMYVSLHGQIGIWLPADEGEGTGAKRGRRMVTYAPGVVFGEIGLMQGRPRSADAIAEEDAVVLELTRADYEELGRSHPALLGKLLLNIGLLLATRVRALTDELETAQAAR